MNNPLYFAKPVPVADHKGHGRVVALYKVGEVERFAKDEQLRQEAKDCKSDLYSFGLLLKRIFPRRYRHIAAKCTRENPNKRYPDMEAMRKTLARSDRWRRQLPLLALVALMIPLVFLAIRPAQPTEKKETVADGMTEDQKKYFEEADWYMNTMVHPIIREAEGGKEYREILQARLSNTIAEMKTMCREMSCLYPINSPEWLAFLTMTTDIQQGRWKGIAKLIKDNCRSFRDDYRKGLISQAEYDSLEWLVTPTVMTLPVTDVTATTATGGIDAQGKGCRGEVEYGLCWGMLHNPTIAGQHINCNQLADSIVMSGLMPNTTYFVRAYVSTSAGIIYDNEIAFTTLPDNWKVATYQLNSVDNADLGFNTNVIGLSDWQHVLEPAGAVFLPKVGVRTIDGVYEDTGYYYSSSAGVGNAFWMAFGNGGLFIKATGHRGDGMAVRLVREVE